MVCQIPFNSRKLMEESARPGPAKRSLWGWVGGPSREGQLACLAAHRRDPGPRSVSRGVGMGKCVTACLPHPFCRKPCIGGLPVAARLSSLQAPLVPPAHLERPVVRGSTGPGRTRCIGFGGNRGWTLRCGDGGTWS